MEKAQSSAVVAEEVSRVFAGRDGSDVVALAGCSLSTATGEFVSLVGPSGCGKTTLLRIIAGILPPTSGSIRVSGRSPKDKKTRLGMVFQQPVLLPWRTAVDNVLLPIEFAGRRGRETETRARDLLALVGLSGHEKQYPRELSGGMQQRVAISRALVRDPEVLLMDEPFGALDALTRSRLDFELLRIWEQTGKSVIFVTHNVAEAVLLSDRVVVMSGPPGRIATTVRVELPRPRTIEQRYSAAFARVEQEIGNHLGVDVIV